MSATLDCHRVSNRTLQAKGILKVIEEVYQPDRPMFALEFENGSQILILADHRYVQYWLENDEHFTKDMHNTRTSSALGRIQFGQSLTFAQDGEEWRRLRTLTTPTLNPKQPYFMKANQKAALWLRDRFADTRTILDLWPLCLEWATQCVLAPFLGTSTSSEDAIRLVTHHQEVFLHLVQQAEHHNKVALHLDAKVHAFRVELAQVLDTALSPPHSHDNTVLGLLIDKLNIVHHPERKAILTDLLMGNLLGGIDNPASTLMWCLIHLASRPEVIAQIRQESINMEHRDWNIQSCPVTMAAIKESLRLSPVQPLIERTTLRDITLDGTTIAKGTHVLFCSWLVHRDPQCWPHPLEFDIGRFTLRQRLDPSKYFPFGVGPRICVGMSLTFHQLAMGLMTLCRHHNWSLNDTLTPLQLRPEFKLNLRPRGPISLNTTPNTMGQQPIHSKEVCS